MPLFSTCAQTGHFYVTDGSPIESTSSDEESGMIKMRRTWKDKYSNLVKEFQTSQKCLKGVCENAIEEGQYFNLFIKYKLEETLRKYLFPFCATIIIGHDTKLNEKEKLMEFLSFGSNKIMLDNVSKKLSELSEQEKEYTIHHQFVLYSYTRGQ